jgi:protein gp37
VTRKSGGRPKWNGRINLDRTSLHIPKRWKTGRTIFVNSMSDLFHEGVPIEFIKEVSSSIGLHSDSHFQPVGYIILLLAPAGASALGRRL